MSRLPVPGGDDNTWGDILNDFLQVSHNADGTLQANAIGAAGGELVNNKGQPSGYASLASSGLVPTTQLGGGTASSSNYLRGDGTWVVPNSGSSSLASDTDVAIVSPTNGEVLTYNTGASKWENVVPAVSNVFGRTGTVTAQSGDYTAAQVTGALQSSNNLSDLASTATARTNLGLGGAATENVGTSAGTVMAGNQAAGGDLTGTYPNPTVTSTANFKTQVETVRLDQMAAPTAAVPLNSQKITGLANGSSGSDAAAFGQIPTSASGIGGLLAANNLSDLASAATARNNLGLGMYVQGSPSGLTLTVASTQPVSPNTGDVWVDNTSTPTTGATGLTPWAPVQTYSSLANWLVGPPANVVTYSGSTYVALANSGPSYGGAITPGTNGAVWALIAQVGTAGGTVALDSSLALTKVGTAVNSATSTGTSADGGHVHASSEWSPADAGYGSWPHAYDGRMNNQLIPSAGVGQCVKVKVNGLTQFSSVTLPVNTAGATLTANQCLVAVYSVDASANQTLLGTSNDQSSNWQTTGARTATFSGSPISIPNTAIYLLIVWWWQGTTGPKFFVENIATIGNVVASGVPRWGTTGSGLTTTAPSTPLTVTANNANGYWAAIT